MTFEEFGKLQDRVIADIKRLRETKGREYATDEDTLADFKEVAAESGVTPLQCWAVYVKKHQRAIDTFIREGAVKSESIESRVTDVIVYHLLLLGLIEDENRRLNSTAEFVETTKFGDEERSFVPTGRVYDSEPHH